MEEIEKTKDLVKTIVKLASEVVNSEITYRKTFEEYQTKETEYRSLKIKLTNLRSFTSTAIPKVIFKDGWHKTFYEYPERKKKIDELKCLKLDVEKYRDKSNGNHAYYLRSLGVLQSFIEKLGETELNNIIEYLDINEFFEYSNHTQKVAMVLKIYRKVISDLKILFESDVNVDFSDIYIGSITLLNVIIDHKNICLDFSKTYTEFQEHLNNLEKEISDLEISKKVLINKAIEIEKFILNRVLKKKKLEQIHDKIFELKEQIQTLNFKRQFYLDKMYKVRMVITQSYKKYQSLYLYLNKIIDALGEKTLYEIIETMDIKFSKNQTEDNYFDEVGELKNSLRKYLNEENIKIMEEIEMDKINLLEKDSNYSEKLLCKSFRK